MIFAGPATNLLAGRAARSSSWSASGEATHQWARSPPRRRRPRRRIVGPGDGGSSPANGEPGGRAADRRGRRSRPSADAPRRSALRPRRRASAAAASSRRGRTAREVGALRRREATHESADSVETRASWDGACSASLAGPRPRARSREASSVVGITRLGPRPTGAADPRSSSWPARISLSLAPQPAAAAAARRRPHRVLDRRGRPRPRDRPGGLRARLDRGDRARALPLHDRPYERREPHFVVGEPMVPPGARPLRVAYGSGRRGPRADEPPSGPGVLTAGRGCACGRARACGRGAPARSLLSEARQRVVTGGMRCAPGRARADPPVRSRGTELDGSALGLRRCRASARSRSATSRSAAARRSSSSR